MNSRKQILEKIHPINTGAHAGGARTGVAKIKVSKFPQPGSSKSTTWDRHRPDHFQAAGKR